MNISYHTIKEINEHIRDLFAQDQALQNIVIRGEVSNVTDRGHIYMTLKDKDNNTLKAVLFKGYQPYVTYIPHLGDEVLLYGTIELYVVNGTYQLIVKDIMPFGEGARLLELEKLRQKLQNEGLFNQEHKKKIPAYPRVIGIITARSGAAIHDMVINIKKRFPVAEIAFFNTSVQGELAPKELNLALNKAINSNVDVIIIGRGGGDKEDLSAFNDETLVRNIYASSIPIISAVGHESDYTLVDYVADLRASTPTDAAIKATPNITDLLLTLDHYHQLLNTKMSNIINQAKREVEACKNRPFFINPASYYQNIQNNLKNMKMSLISSMSYQIKEKMSITSQYKEILNRALTSYLNAQKQHLQNQKTILQTLNPKLLLDKGYSLTLDENNQVITNIDAVKLNSTLKTVLKDGIIESKVTKKE